MIRKVPYWVYSFNDDNAMPDSATGGKWIMFAPEEQMERIFPRIDELVEQGRISVAKYRHFDTPQDPYAGYGLDPSLCVYADDSTKESALQELEALGIEGLVWRYDKDTIADWKPGGKYYELTKALKKNMPKG